MQKINEISTHDEEEVSSSSGSLGGGSKNSGTSAHTTNTKFSDSDAHEVAIRMEERAIKRAKLMVGGGILVCAVAVLLSVFFLTKSSDDRSFELAVSVNSPTFCHQQFFLDSHTPSDSLLKVRRTYRGHPSFNCMGSSLQLCFDGTVQRAGHDFCSRYQ